MSNQELYIYVPGLGREGMLHKQQKQVNGWNSKSVKAIQVDPRWHDLGEPYPDKLARVKKQIIEFLGERESTELHIVGSSAGGSLGLNIFYDLRCKEFISIAGKMQGASRIGQHYQKSAPALADSVKHSEKIIMDLKPSEARRITSYIPLFDEVVPLRDMKISGASNKRLPVPFHVLGITFGLFLLKHKIN